MAEIFHTKLEGFCIRSWQNGDCLCTVLVGQHSVKCHTKDLRTRQIGQLMFLVDNASKIHIAFG